MTSHEKESKSLKDLLKALIGKGAVESVLPNYSFNVRSITPAGLYVGEVEYITGSYFVQVEDLLVPNQGDIHIISRQAPKNQSVDHTVIFTSRVEAPSALNVLQKDPDGKLSIPGEIIPAHRAIVGMSTKGLMPIEEGWRIAKFKRDTDESMTMLDVDQKVSDLYSRLITISMERFLRS